jgi:two-component system, OmpR family, response regulator
MGEVIRVLCVDDNRDAAESAADVLRATGCEVRACMDGRTALAVAAEFRPDVCVLDLLMPGMGGEELARRLREQAGGRPIRLLAVTGLWDIETQHRTRNGGFNSHLVKPVDPGRLVESVTSPDTVT